MTKKTIINIVYSPQKDPPRKIYENEKGEIWNSPTRDVNKINVSMGWYSIPKPKEGDCCIVVEPICVLERDYEERFVKKFKYIFTWADKAFEKTKVKDKVIYISHPTYHNTVNPKISDSWPNWDQREDKIVFVASNKTSEHYSELYSFRLKLADILYKESKLKVEWYGQIPVKKPYYKGSIADKNSLLSESKFSVCTENCYDSVYSHNYFTEKMPDVWKAGAVPIYFGCYNIDDFNLPSSSYIDLRNFCNKNNKRWEIKKEDLINTIDSFNNENYLVYKESLVKDILSTDKLYKLTTFNDLFNKLLDTLSKSL